MVNEYVYLGIPFSASALFTSALNLAMSKANLAIGTTVPLLYKLNPESWSTEDKLFESLVSSNALYAAQIWSLRYLDSIEKINTKLYKTVLNVPQNTPNYAIRIETGSSQLALRIFKNLF